jgi:hypothetical protein
MSRTESSMVQLGAVAPDFQLVNVLTGDTVTLDDVRGTANRSGLLIMFVCVHCPYVKHVEAELARIGEDYFGESGDGPIAIAAIQSNDVEQYPEDGPEHMREQANRLGWRFPYLLDATQEVARPTSRLHSGFLPLRCRCDWPTEASLIPADRGVRTSATTSRSPAKTFDQQWTLSSPDGSPIADQRSSIGCNIKWREVA